MANTFTFHKSIEKTINSFAYGMVQDLTNNLKDNIENNFKSCIFTGTPNISFSMKVEGNENNSKPNGEVSVNGVGASFIEFGTGVRYNGSANSSPHEWATRTTPPALIGTYGQGKGQRNAWAFYGDDVGNDPNSFVHQNKNGTSVVITRGIQAQYPIFNGYKEMKKLSQDKYECEE